MTSKFVILTGLGLLVSACGSATTSAGRSSPATAGMRPATNDHRGAPSPLVAAQAGEIVGRDRAALISLFGQPRVDMQEGAATRMQFGSDRCVLDAYLYAPRSGAAPVVTHVDARTPTGEDAERSACIAALRRR